MRGIASIQFRGFGREIIPEDVELLISPSTRKIRRLVVKDELYLSLRASDYRFVLHMPAARVINSVLPHPFIRVYVNNYYSAFVRERGNLFAKHVVAADPSIRPGDEVVIVDADSYDVIGVGRAVKPGWAMPLHGWGEAVRVRERSGERACSTYFTSRDLRAKS